MSSIIDILKTAGVIAIVTVNQMSGIRKSTSNGKAAVVNVYSEFCGYSKVMADKFVSYVPVTGNKNISFYGADANKLEGLTGQYGIKGVPTFIGYACGKELDRVTGADEPGLSALMTKLGNAKC